MQIFQRLLLFLAPVAWIVGLEAMKQNHAWWLASALLVLASVFFVTWYACNRKFNRIFFNFLILPLLLAVSGFIMALFIVNAVFFHALVGLVAFLLYVLLRQYFFYFNLPFRFQPYSLESLSLCIGLISAYFLFAGCFGGLLLLQFTIWLMLPILLSAGAFCAYQFFWINKINFEKSRLVVLVIVLALAELFYAVSSLPTSYFINAFVLVVFFYMMLGAGKLYFLNALTQKKVLTYFIVAAAALVAVFLTAQWT